MNSKTGKIDETTQCFIAPYARKWKSKTIFQVLLHYRAVRYQDLVNFCQQTHFFNQRLVSAINAVSACVHLNKVNPKEFQKEMLGLVRPSVLKIPFRYDLLPYFDTTFLCDPEGQGYAQGYESEEENWDAPLRRRKTTSANIARSAYMEPQYGFDDEYLVNEPYIRGPGIRRIAPRKHSEGHLGGRVQFAGPSNSNYVPSYVQQSHYDDFESPNLVKSTIYKKKPAPSPPPMNYTHLRKVAPAPPPPTSSYVPVSYETPKVDPIREMKMIGKANNDEVYINDEIFVFFN